MINFRLSSRLPPLTLSPLPQRPHREAGDWPERTANRSDKADMEQESGSDQQTDGLGSKLGPVSVLAEGEEGKRLFLLPTNHPK